MMMILQFLLIILSSIIAYIIYQLFIKIYIELWKFRKMDPSIKSIVSPLLGLVGQQEKSFKKYGDSFHYAKQMMKQNNDLKAYATNIGHLSILVFCDTQMIKEYLLESKKFRKFNLYKHSSKGYLQGIFFTEDERWSRQRSITKNAFNHECIKKMIPIIQDSIGKFTVKITGQINAAENRKVNFKVLTGVEALIGEMLVKIIFGVGVIDTKIRGKPLSTALTDYTVQIYQCSRALTNVFWSMFFGQKVSQMNFTKQDKDLYNYINEIREVLKEVIDTRFQNGQNSQQKDFLQVYVNKMKQNNRLISQAKQKGQQTAIVPIQWQQVMHQLISFYFAGVDTTAHLTSFTLYCLAEYPQYTVAIKEEIKKIFGDGIQYIKYEDLSKMEFTEHFIDEVLRMWPPLPQHLERIAKVDVQIGPYKIPKGTLVGSSLVACMNNPKYYENPEIFDPYRWTKPGGYKTDPHSFIPFSAGPRSCIGKYLALLEVKILIIYFLNNFNLERTEVPLRTHVKLLYEPYDDNLVRLTPGGMQIK